MNDSRKKMLADLLIGAVEGGTGYWAQISEYNHDGEPEDTRAVFHVQDLPARAPALRRENDEFCVPVNIAVVNKGLRAAANDKELKIRQDLRQQCKVLDASDGIEQYYEAVDWDAETCDVVLQVALFGEIVYG